MNEIPFRLNLEHYVSSPPMGTPNVQAPLSESTPTLTTWGMILLAGALLLLGMKAAGRSAVVQQYPARRVRIA